MKEYAFSEEAALVITKELAEIITGRSYGRSLDALIDAQQALDAKKVKGLLYCGDFTGTASPLLVPMPLKTTTSHLMMTEDFAAQAPSEPLVQVMIAAFLFLFLPWLCIYCFITSIGAPPELKIR